MNSVIEKFKRVCLSLLNQRSEIIPQCESCIIVFIEDAYILHILKDKIIIYKADDTSRIFKTVPLKQKIEKQFLYGKWIKNSSLVGVVQADKKFQFLNFMTGVIEKVVYDAYYFCDLGRGSLLLFGTNHIRSVCKRTYKVINSIKTQYASPAFSVDINNNLILVGAYCDLYFYDSLLREKTSINRAHELSVSCVKIISNELAVTGGENFSLTLWHIIQNQTEFQVIKQKNFSLQYIIPKQIYLCPYSENALLIESNSQIRYIPFTTTLKTNHIDFSRLKIKTQNLNSKDIQPQLLKSLDKKDQVRMKNDMTEIKIFKTYPSQNKIIAFLKPFCQLVSFNLQFSEMPKQIPSQNNPPYNILN